MIKTSHKSKPIKGLTHSLGAKKISESLTGIRIYDNLSISFDKVKGNKMGVIVPGWSVRYMKGESRDLLEYRRIISGTYSEPLDQWTLNLKATDINSNTQTKDFLTTVGLPLMRNWFESEKPETWYSGHRYFIIGLNENITKYCTWETHNDRTIKKTTGVINIPKK